MRWLTLYLRSRRAPMALAVAAGCAGLMWSLWAIFSKDRQVAPQMVVLTVLLLVSILTLTLSSPDYALDRTAALSWPPRRAAHLLAALLIVVGSLVLTRYTAAHFGPASVLLRDAAGLLGLTALGASLLTPARSWFLPLGWTLIAVLFPRTETVADQLLTWQSQAPDNRPAVLLALLLALAGLVTYALAGPSRRATADLPA
ncbi:hypothetical protein BJY16_001390 [Actinoplanes octamycinicus]|uniref:Uncharacterized protein n=1 Tax=Actinoplanes octamycinicus TaxID=135948 RepID=A0A7W7GTC9_9ACTN|nr:hypothetical protein [Actinoplanes octamycinicus]MBB4737931.1 hypothetical protein [Actinoplanes octamycinicus]GIE59015.1 hypothetical protein Aoc01nite_44170 [Actinoplanes octamycinicus]